VYTENLRGGAPSNQDAAVRAQPLQPPEAATPIIKKVISQMASEDGWVTLGEVGRQLANFASDFDQRTYGFRTLGELVRRTNAFEIESKGGTMRIRIKPAAAPPPRRRAPRRRADQKSPE
ncbi:OST-HTH/LOTUS domain-containing protein, partial [Bradyrhizobium brasilense]